MTPAKLQELAREAGLSVDGDSVRSPHLDCVALGDLARFAAIVRAAALEEALRKINDVEPVTYHFGGQIYDDARATLGACEDVLRALAQQAGGEAPPC